MITIPTRVELRRQLIEGKYDEYCLQIIEDLKKSGKGRITVCRNEIDKEAGYQVLDKMEKDFKAAGYYVNSYTYGDKHPTLFWIEVEI